MCCCRNHVGEGRGLWELGCSMDMQRDGKGREGWMYVRVDCGVWAECGYMIKECKVVLKSGDGSAVEVSVKEG